MLPNCMYLYLLSGAFVVAVAAAFIDYFYHTKYKNYPPGPRPLPIIGNLFDVPASEDYKNILSSWRELYGGIAYYRVFNTHFVILNDYKMIIDLFDKRGTNYSARPQLAMATLSGLQTAPLLLQYGKRLKTTRKLINNFMRKSSLEKQVSTIELQTFECLANIANSPARLMGHLKRHPGDLSLKISFGDDAMDESDELVKSSEEVIDVLSTAITPGQWLVDLFPQLRYIPSFLPGGSFKKWAKDACMKGDGHSEVFQRLINVIRANGNSYLPNFYTESSHISGGEDDDVLIKAASSMYLGLRQNMYSTLKLFYKTIAHNPDMQSRMQAEIDSVIGDHRLPDLSDRDSLPYTNAVMKELLRLDPAMLPVAHSNERDDVYEGYFIPKGTWVVANSCYFTRNPTIYSDPFEFKPERYFATPTRAAEPDPSKYVFGFGRRACPGANLGQMTLLHALACMVWLFEISPGFNEKVHYGHEDEPNYYNYNLAVRSEVRLNVLKERLSVNDTVKA